jgi:cell division protein FtsB
LVSRSPGAIMDLASIGSAVGTLKTAADIAKVLIGLKPSAEVQAQAIALNTKIIDAQHQIFAAHAAQTELVERVRELESQVTSMKDWDAQKKRYELASPFPGCMVYALKKSMSDGQPPHYICTSCFDKGERSILQGKETRVGHSYYLCNSCKSQAETQWNNVIAPKYFEEIAAQP